MDDATRLVTVHSRIKIRPHWTKGTDGEAESWPAEDCVQQSLKFHASAAARLKATDDDGRLHITSLASTPDIDEMDEIVEPSAFASSIETFAEIPIMLAYHKMDQPVGLWTKQTITNQGLHLEGFVSEGRPDIQRLVLDGVLAHSSIGFVLKDAQWDDELEVLRITDLDLREVSLVPVPANRSTFVSLNEAFRSWRDDEIDRRKSLREVPAETPAPAAVPDPEPVVEEPPDEVLDGIELAAARIAESFARALRVSG